MPVTYCVAVDGYCDGPCLVHRAWTYPNTWHLTFFFAGAFLAPHFFGTCSQIWTICPRKSRIWMSEKPHFFSPLGVFTKIPWTLELPPRSVSFGANAVVLPTTPSPSRNKTLRIVSLRPRPVEGRRRTRNGRGLGLFWDLENTTCQQFFW